MTIAVEFKNVDIIFGDRANEALEMARAGSDRAEILAKTGAVLGATGANLVVNEGEISVLMGLSGSGKSTLLRAVNGLNKVTDGEVMVKDGNRMVDVASCDEATLRHIRQKQVAMVFQKFGVDTAAELAAIGEREAATEVLDVLVDELPRLPHNYLATGTLAIAAIAGRAAQHPALDVASDLLAPLAHLHAVYGAGCADVGPIAPLLAPVPITTEGTPP